MATSDVQTPAATPVAAAATPAAASPVVDPSTPPVPAAVAKPEPKQGAAFAQLAKKEKANREAAEKLKADRIAFEAQQNEYKAFQDAKAQAKRFPLKFLEANGLTYQDLTDAIMNDGQPTPNLEVKAVRDELEAFKKAQEDERKALLDEQKRHAEAEVAKTFQAFDKECADFVATHSDKYEYTALLGQQDRVAQLVKDHWALQESQGVENPVLLSIEEAADAVEKDIEENWLSKATTAKKFQAKVKPPEVSPQAANKRPTPDQQPRSVTNSLASSTQGARPPAKSRQEREARAKAILEGL